MPRRPQKQDADEAAERPDDEPVAPELPARRGIGDVHACLRGEPARADPEVDDSLARVRAVVGEKTFGRRRSRRVATRAENPPELTGEPEDDPLSADVVEHDARELAADERFGRVSVRAGEPSQ